MWARAHAILLALMLAFVPAAAVAQIYPPLAGPVAAPTADDVTIGSPDAPVTLTVYVDSTCVHCAIWLKSNWKDVRDTYAVSGDVRVVFRMLLTPPHELAILGNAVARCAPAERLPAVFTAFFQHMQENGGDYPEPGSEEASVWLRTGGAAGGMDSFEVDACLANGAIIAAVERQNKQAIEDGLTGIPTFFVDQVATMSGWRDDEPKYAAHLRQQLDAAIQNAGAR